MKRVAIPRIEFKISKRCTYFVSIGMLIIAALRFWDLYKFSLILGNSRGLLGTISSTRLAYATGKYTGLSFVLIISTLVSEVICYIYMYMFLYAFEINRKKKMYLLLPVLAYCLIVVSFTGRTEYLKLMIIAFVMWIALVYKNPYKMNRKSILLKKMIKYAVIGAVVFFLYGRLVREDNDGALINIILAYSAAAIVGLNTYILNGWKENPYFGFYTLQNIYDFLGVEYTSTAPHHLSFFSVSDTLSSNIYTGFTLLIQDFGWFGMLVILSIMTIITCICIKAVYSSSLYTSDIVFKMVFLGQLLYCFFSMPIAFRFSDLIFSPTTIIKYTLFVYIISYMFFNVCINKRRLILTS